MRNGQMIQKMRDEGFNVTRGYVDFLLRERHLPRPTIAGPLLDWRAADLDRLRS
ncbi:unnamed protein product, partial [marine sediment metagenome]